MLLNVVSWFPCGASFLLVLAIGKKHTAVVSDGGAQSVAAAKLTTLAREVRLI